ncbi:MAG TPA: polysaccharide pyruvyl transferase family protein, partial [Blastocatellia bacterium]
MISIGHWGTFDVENYGDLMFPLILEKELTKRLGVVSVTLASPCGGRFQGQPSRRIERIARIGESEFVEQSIRFDAFVLGGGDIVRFDDQFLAEIYESSIGPVESAGIGAVFLRELGALARIFPVFWNAPGVPHDFTPEQCGAVRDAVEHVNYLSVRDQASKTRLERAGVEREVKIAPDTAFLLREIFPRGQLCSTIERLKATGLFPRAGKTLCFHASFTSQSAEANIAQILTRVLDLHPELNVVMLPIGACHGDRQTLGRIYGMMGGMIARERTFFCDTRLDVEDITAMVANSDFLASSSLHGNIAAWVYGVDSIILSLAPYSPSKLVEYAKWLERPLVTSAQDLLPAVD